MNLTFRLSHILIAVIGGLLVWLLLQDAPGSHPHPSIFLLFVVPLWLLLHLLIGIAQIALWRGKLKLPVQRRKESWPLALIAAVLLYLGHLARLPALLLALITNYEKWSILHSISLAATLFSAVCLLSILLRWPASRYLAGAGLIAMAALPLFRVAMAFFYDFNVLRILAAAPYGLLVGAGVYLLRAAAVQDFLAARNTPELTTHSMETP